MLMDFLGNISTALWGYILIAVLLGVGLYFTVITRFIQFRLFGEMFRVLFEKESIKNDGRGTSAFQSFTISTASRVGTGNLGGVALAVSVGGPGAVFWMWIIALLGSATSFVESTLAQVYKVKDEEGYRGGPAYYMEKGLNNRKLGIAFAIIITFTYGLVFSAVQSNTIRLAFEESFSVNKVLIGVVLVVGSAAVIFGGIQRIAKVTQIFIPVMAILYLILAGYVLITNIGAIPDMFVLIFKNAFGIEEVAGGAFGAAILNGIKRGLFSNEAGMGSAPNAAAAAEVSHPAKQGLIQTLGVFVDTILICSATAFIIISSGDPASYMNQENAVGIQITQQAFETHIGSWANTFVAIAILFFAFSSIIGNYYYGETNMQFIKNSPKRIFWYRLAALAMVFFGAMAKLDLVWLLADITMGIMALINLYAIVRLSGVAKEVLLDYRSDRKKEHKTKFSKDQIKNKEGISLWE